MQHIKNPWKSFWDGFISAFDMSGAYTFKLGSFEDDKKALEDDWKKVFGRNEWFGI